MRLKEKLRKRPREREKLRQRERERLREREKLREREREKLREREKTPKAWHAEIDQAEGGELQTLANNILSPWSIGAPESGDARNVVSVKVAVSGALSDVTSNASRHV